MVARVMATIKHKEFSGKSSSVCVEPDDNLHEHHASDWWVVTWSCQSNLQDVSFFTSFEAAGGNPHRVMFV